MFDIFYIGKKPNLFSFEREVSSLDEALKMSKTRCFWVINYLCDYSNFDFLWEPVPWEAHHQHAFSSQWQKDSGTYLVPKEGADDINYHADICIPRLSSNDVYLIDHGNKELDNVIKQLESKGLTIKKKARFISSYHGTLERILSQETDEFVWVCSSICDYSDFDFSWHPDQWQLTMFHVFPSNEQRFGDTFLINTVSFNDRIKKTEILEWYDTINFVSDMPVKRWPTEVVKTDTESQVPKVLEHTFTSPIVLFTNRDTINFDIPTINLWREKTRTVIPLSNGGNTLLVTRDAKNYIRTQLYDYEFINKKHKNLQDDPLDIVFISNGESNADENWEHLLSIVDTRHKVHRVDKVNGRLKSARAAAKLSGTSWFFCINAKLKVNPNFDWNWQPDRMQESKHYIFYARNPITELEYGHMAMTAWNKKLVNTDTNWGLDFTMSHVHEVVTLNSGIAYYGNDPWMAWRTAFRETLKLKYMYSLQKDIDTEYRINAWLNSNKGEFGEWSQKGATDAVEYFIKIAGELELIQLSYEWDWLDSYFNSTYD